MACCLAHALMFGSLRAHGLMYAAGTHKHQDDKAGAVHKCTKSLRF